MPTKLPTLKITGVQDVSVPPSAAKAGLALVGVTELALNQARATQGRIRSELSPERLSGRVNAQWRRVADLPRQARTLPGAAMEQGLAVSSVAEHRYDDLAARGRVLLTQLRDRQAQTDLPVRGTVSEVRDDVDALLDEFAEAVSVPAVKKPATRKPAARKSSTGKPTTRKSAAKKQAAKKPAARKSATNKPATRRATTA